MTEASGPQKSGGPRPTALSRRMSRQQEPSTGTGGKTSKVQKPLKLL